LIHEKDNIYSENAIKIIHEGFEIGYVPDEITGTILPIINQTHQALISNVLFNGAFIDVYVKLYFKE
ncbi:MAG: hypothetical protein KBT69_15620, partial [Oceanihabitans sp.]|nr:hypothetical protein [Oceanihabitans sp.]